MSGEGAEYYGTPALGGVSFTPEQQPYIAELLRLRKEAESRKWISVKDRLPGISGYFIVAKGGFVFSTFYESYSKKWIGDFCGNIKGITHWMPWPDPPKEDEV